MGQTTRYFFLIGGSLTRIVSGLAHATAFGSKQSIVRGKSGAIHELFIDPVPTAQSLANEFVIQAFDVEEDVIEHVSILFCAITSFVVIVQVIKVSSRQNKHGIIASLQNVSRV